MTASLSLQNVSLRYGPGSPPVISQVNFYAEGGKNIMLIGDNGSGKTTLGKAICGHLNPSEGSITVNGQNLCELSVEKRIKFACFLNQSSVLQFFRSTLKEEIKLTMKAARADSLRVMSTKRYYLPDDLDFNPFDLSVNEAWRFSLYLSMVVDPGVLFIDEIPSSSNSRNMDVLSYVLSKRSAEHKITFASYQRSLRTAFDSVLSIDCGKLSVKCAQ